MRSDLDLIMENQEIDALLITGPAQHNPAMYYMTGGGHLTQADLIKKRGAEPILFFNPMERDEAAKTGLLTKDLSEYRLEDLIKQSGGNLQTAFALCYQKMLTDLDLTSSRIAIYGKVEASRTYGIFSALQEAMPDLKIVGQVDDSALLQAMATKDDEEIDRIRQIGNITTSVVGQVAEFLTSHSIENEVLVKKDNKPLTIGDVKHQINVWLAEHGAENPKDTIFAIGKDSGVPHSSGTPSDLIRLGQTIVFDIFPCESGGGYFYDFTRTWCLGYATDEALAIYEDVLSVYNQIMDELEVNSLCRDYQRRTCELFEAMEHPTIHNNPQTKEGYVHSLGHGVGLNVHERPSFGRNATSEDRLLPGSVVSIEPGLYYPNRGIGVRLEDTVRVRPDGIMEVLAEYPLDLILTM